MPLVEAEGVLRNVISKFLVRSGAVVVAFPCGDEAAQQWESWNRFDILVMDLVMPGALLGDGLALGYMDANPDKPVIILSGNPDLASKVGPKGPSDFTVLMKPVQRVALLQHEINSLIRCRRAGFERWASG